MVKQYSVEEMVPPDTPFLIPYLESYRTDELYYKEYESPYNSAESGNVEGATLEDLKKDADAEKTDGSTKARLQGLEEEVKNAVKTYYKSSAFLSAITEQYLNAKTTKESVGAVTKLHYKHLKDGIKITGTTNAIYEIKLKYAVKYN